MADAKQCDRCDKFYKPYDGLPILTNQDKTQAGFKYNKIILETRHSNVGKLMDLCPECMSKLIYFLFYEDDEEREGDI
jgi:hypothetical protein